MFDPDELKSTRKIRTDSGEKEIEETESALAGILRMQMLKTAQLDLSTDRDDPRLIVNSRYKNGVRAAIFTVTREDESYVPVYFETTTDGTTPRRVLLMSFDKAEETVLHYRHLDEYRSRLSSKLNIGDAVLTRMSVEELKSFDATLDDIRSPWYSENHMGHHSKHKGFTIIELIIVVVVIAILAAITITAYRGVTKSAYNTQIISGTKSYYDAIKTYNLVKHTYPKTQRELDGQRIAMTCLGIGYKNKACGQVTGVNVYEDATFNAQMLAFLKTATNPVSNMTIPVPGESYVGAVYGIDSTSASSTGYARVIEYALHGKNQSCGISDAWVYNTSDNSTACEIVIEEISF